MAVDSSEDLLARVVAAEPKAVLAYYQSRRRPPPRDQNVLSIFLNLRVTDISRYYDLWSSRAAHFITEPKVHATELRCYMRDPDGYHIEVGQTTMTTGSLDSYA